MLESSTNPQLIGPWEEVIDRWAPPLPDKVDDPQAQVRREVARVLYSGDEVLLEEFGLSHAPLCVLAAMDFYHSSSRMRSFKIHDAK
ncbi:hypothetical protein LJR290_006810 [Variovorax sp. LjRoot290]|uniref:hypothetical protein n=1 Tax=Variovorax sp. LjRoot290 TaxID=3342316 RepID=UPI003ECF86A0